MASAPVPSPAAISRPPSTESRKIARRRLRHRGGRAVLRSADFGLDPLGQRLAGVVDPERVRHGAEDLRRDAGGALVPGISTKATDAASIAATASGGPASASARIRSGPTDSTPSGESARM